MINLTKEFGAQILSARLVRLSETIIQDTANYLEANNIAGIKPRAIGALLLMDKHGDMTVTEMASILGFSHPTIIALVKELEDMKYLTSKSSKEDKRKRIVSLTAKGKSLIAKLDKTMSAYNATFKRLLGADNALLKAIDDLEAKLSKESLIDRVTKSKK
jgi:DNA-binding MarR family transcriptional regulator